MRVGLYLTGRKGLMVLQALSTSPLKSHIHWISVDRDSGNLDDCSDKIHRLKDELNITPHYLTKAQGNSDVDWRFAIGWRKMIEDSHNLIVLHDSLLPKYRGFAPVVQALILGDTTLGATAFLAGSEYDSGPIIQQARISIKYPIKIQEAIQIMGRVYADMVIGIMAGILDKSLIVQTGEIRRQEQNHDCATYSLWRDEADYRVNWSWSTERIKRFVDAVGYPYAGARCECNTVPIPVKLTDVEIVPNVVVEDRFSHIGKVIFIQNGYPVVVCGSGLLKLDMKISSIRTRFH